MKHKALYVGYLPFVVITVRSITGKAGWLGVGQHFPDDLLLADLCLSKDKPQAVGKMFVYCCRLQLQITGVGE